MLASLTTHALSTILRGLTTGLLTGGINKAISGSGAVGDGLILHKHGKYYQVQKCKVGGLYLAPHPRFVEGECLCALFSVIQQRSMVNIFDDSIGEGGVGDLLVVIKAMIRTSKFIDY